MEKYQAERIAPDLQTEITHAQYRMLASYMPLMYVSQIVTGMLLGALFSRSALLFVTVFRLSYWLNPRLPATESHQRIVRTVAQAPYFAFFYYAVISFWVVDMAAGAKPSDQMLAAFYIAISTFSGISFNAHLPRCALGIVLTGSLPLVAYLISIDTHEALAFAAIYACCAIVQIIVIRRQHVDFVDAVRVGLMAEASRSDTEAARRDIARVANTDPLTGLPNRRALLNAITHAIDQKSEFAFGLIDLDGFKPINDVYGHSAGDEVLFTVAGRFRTSIGKRGMVARLGGDEFGFILFDVPANDDLLEFTRGIIKAADRPIPLDDGHATLSACCGIALYPATTEAATELLQRADEALYAAKRSGRGTAVVYGDELESKQKRRLLIDARLRIAIAERAFTLAYQPLVDLRTGRITSYEALARWTDPLLGPVSPAEFIPIAEQSGLITAVSEILYRRALSEAANWPQDVALSFNVSAQQIHNASLALRTLAILAEHRFPPERLVLEMTETAVLTDVAHAATVIEQLQGAGIRFALDDFGVGYAGFSYLEKLTFDELKIDRSFVSGMKQDKRKRQIVKAIIEMCHSLDIRCVAEGIESEDELELVKALGCDTGQGYLLGRPGAVVARAAAQPQIRAVG